MIVPRTITGRGVCHFPVSVCAWAKASSREPAMMRPRIRVAIPTGLTVGDPNTRLGRKDGEETASSIIEPRPSSLREERRLGGGRLVRVGPALVRRTGSHPYP